MSRNILKLDTKGFDAYAEKLDRLGADLKEIFTKALEEAGEKIGEDTISALATNNLPRGGKYSKDRTKQTVVRAPKATWAGMFGSVNVGFDFSKPGSGGYLITGTPKMKPDAALNKIYKKKAYMNDIQKGMAEVFDSEIKKHMGG